MSRWRPVGNRILVELLEEKEEKTESGLVLAKDYDNERDPFSGQVIGHKKVDSGRLKMRQDVGKVVTLGRDCWVGLTETPWCKEGDVIKFQPYSGADQKEADGDIKFRYIKDKDVIAVLEE